LLHILPSTKIEQNPSILGGLSLLAGSAAPGEEPPPKNKKVASTEAKHTNLTHRLNVPSSHPAQAALNRRDLFSQKILFQTTAPSFLAWLSRTWPRSAQQKHCYLSEAPNEQEKEEDRQNKPPFKS